MPKTQDAAKRQLNRWIQKGRLQGLSRDPSFAGSPAVIATLEELDQLLDVFINSEALRSRGYTEQALTQISLCLLGWPATPAATAATPRSGRAWLCSAPVHPCHDS